MKKIVLMTSLMLISSFSRLAIAADPNTTVKNILNYSIEQEINSAEFDNGVTHRQLRKNLRWILKGFSERQEEVPVNFAYEMFKIGVGQAVCNTVSDATGADNKALSEAAARAYGNPFKKKYRTVFKANEKRLALFKKIQRAYRTQGVAAAYQALDLRSENMGNSHDKFLGCCADDFRTNDCYELSLGMIRKFRLNA